jgi:uncharacterized YigZ family protein
MDPKLIPGRETRIEMKVKSSRFIATIAPVFSLGEAKTFLAGIKMAFADASHNVPAYVIGHGASVITHCSDDGEPSGTAGRPALSVLMGSGLGDAAVVVTRYFGGTKLGTGGLVRAYSAAVRSVIEEVPVAQKISATTASIRLPYALFEQISLMTASFNGLIVDRTFSADVRLIVQFPSDQLHDFQQALQELSRGRLQADILEEDQTVIAPLNAKPKGGS